MNEPVPAGLAASEGSRAAGAQSAGGLLSELCGPDLAGRLGPLRVTHLHHREIVYRECRKAQSIHLVISGLVKLVSHVTDDRTRIVRLLSAGDFLGLDGLFQTAYRQTASALGEVSLYRIPLPLLRRLRSDEPRLYCRLLEQWYVHLDYADTWITQFSTGPIRPRVARLLKFLSRVESPAQRARVRLLTCDEMAEVLGVTPESVSRSLAEFKRDGLLRRALKSDPEVFFCDLAALDDVARGVA